MTIPTIPRCLEKLKIRISTVEPRLSDLRFTDLPGYPTYQTKPSTPRYPTEIG